MFKIVNLSGVNHNSVQVFNSYDVKIFFCGGGGPYGLQGDGGWMNRGQQDVMGGGGY